VYLRCDQHVFIYESHDIVFSMALRIFFLESVLFLALRSFPFMFQPHFLYGHTCDRHDLRISSLSDTGASGDAVSSELAESDFSGSRFYSNGDILHTLKALDAITG